MTWKITYDSVQHEFTNDTSRSINRNLWNHLTIDANMQTEFKIVKHLSQSNMIDTQKLWDDWMSFLPVRMQKEQINELVLAIINSEQHPERAISILNDRFLQMDMLYKNSRTGLYGAIFLPFIAKVKFFRLI